MKRALPIIVLSLLAAAAACADSNDGPRAPADHDASVPAPQSDGGVDPEASVEAGTEAGAEAGARPSCNEDGWCLVSLPNPRPVGVSNFRVVGLAMDAPGKVWAATNSFPLGDGDPTSHLLHYESGKWTLAYGIGPQQAGPFPYTLNAIAGNGAGSFMAVGKTSSWMVWPPAPVVLRIENGKVTEEHPEGLRAFTGVAFTSATDAWALDDEGRLYKTSISDAVPLVWTEQETPHPPDPDTFQRGPTTLFVSTTGTLMLGGQVDGRWTEDGYVPPFAYVDRRMDDGSWVSSNAPDGLWVTAGVAADSASVWLAGSFFLGATQLPDGGTDAGAAVWTRTPENPNVTISSLWARGPNDVWGVGTVGRVLRFDGTTWSDAKLALKGVPMTVEWLNAVTGWSATGELWVGGESVVMHYTPKGTP